VLFPDPAGRRWEFRYPQRRGVLADTDRERRTLRLVRNRLRCSWDLLAQTFG